MPIQRARSCMSRRRERESLKQRSGYRNLWVMCPLYRCWSMKTSRLGNCAVQEARDGYQTMDDSHFSCTEKCFSLTIRPKNSFLLNHSQEMTFHSEKGPEGLSELPGWLNFCCSYLRAASRQGSLIRGTPLPRLDGRRSRGLIRTFTRKMS